MLLDVLDNLPRLRLSSSQFKMILWLLKECHVKDTPSFGAFRKLQHKLRGSCGTQPTVHTSSVGNIFYANDVRESVVRVGESILFISYCLYKSIFRISQTQKLSNILSFIPRKRMDAFQRPGELNAGRNSSRRSALLCMLMA